MFKDLVMVPNCSLVNYLDDDADVKKAKELLSKPIHINATDIKRSARRANLSHNYKWCIE